MKKKFTVACADVNSPLTTHGVFAEATTRSTYNGSRPSLTGPLVAWLLCLAARCSLKNWPAQSKNHFRMFCPALRKPKMKRTTSRWSQKAPTSKCSCELVRVAVCHFDLVHSPQFTVHGLGELPEPSNAVLLMTAFDARNWPFHAENSFFSHERVKCLRPKV